MNKNIRNTIDDCKILQLPKITDSRGALTFIEEENHIPFHIKRVYYLYDLSGIDRGIHAHKELEQLYISLSGSFKIIIDDGIKKREYLLDKSSQGLYICPMIWRKIYDISKGSILLVLASQKYNENDYIRNYEKFMKKVKELM